VQFLREFRDQRILSTAAGSSFMNAFNGWYYSFSPHVADYEREQPWLQAAVRAGIQPLLGILAVSEKAYSAIPGELGSVAAGLAAS
jgi:peptide/nickel transport system substrate-binding protein